MISEDKNATANLPQNVIMKEYPKLNYEYSDLDDSIKTIDAQIKEDRNRQDMKFGKKFPEKY